MVETEPGSHVRQRAVGHLALDRDRFLVVQRPTLGAALADVPSLAFALPLALAVAGALAGAVVAAWCSRAAGA